MDSYQSFPLPEQGVLRLKVQTITGQAFLVTLQPTETVADIKKKLEATPGIEVAPDRQRLFFAGTELADHLKLNEIPRLEDNSTIQIFLRSSAPSQQPQTPDANHVVQVATPIFGADSLFYPPLLQQDDLHGYSSRVEKSALNIRLIGILFVVMGLINAVVTLTSTPSDWESITTAVLLVILGGMGIRAGISKTTTAAKRYFLSIILFIIAFSIIFIISSILTDSGQSTSDIFVTILVGIFFPLFLCSFCAFCAKRHLTLCRSRDMYEIQLRDPQPPPQQATLVSPTTLVSPGIGQPLLDQHIN
jgi:hypothetical protein